MAIKKFILGLAAIMCFASLANAADMPSDYQQLKFFFTDQEIFGSSTSATRAEKPLSQTPENVIIITSDEIELSGAKTLADLLFYVTGVESFASISPGFPSPVTIQGSDSRHVLLVIDGVRFNNLADSIADFGAVPVQQIARVEIVKGPASSAWGSALGGVINVITKDPSNEPAGSVSASYGERNTGDFRGEISGTPGDFGYYVSGGHLQSNGFTPGTEGSLNNFYSKAAETISDSVKVGEVFYYSSGQRGLLQASALDLSERDKFENYYGKLGLDAALCPDSTSADCELSISTWAGRRHYDEFLSTISSGLDLGDSLNRDDFLGGSAKFIYKREPNEIVIGSDLSSERFYSNEITGGEQNLKKEALYANDTISIHNNLSFTPGLRYDHTSTNGSFVSPSAGLTYSPFKDLLFRGMIEQGFNIPSLSDTFGTGFLFVPNSNLSMEKACSYQLGIETSALKYVWLKASLFRHDLSNVIEPEQTGAAQFTFVNAGKARREGYELEAKSVSYHNFSLSGGFEYIQAKDLETGENETDVPRYTWDVAVKYIGDGFRGILMGRYTWWGMPAEAQGNYNAFIWDANVIKTICSRHSVKTEAFLHVHNIFNGSQYPLNIYRNASRWIEVGLKLNF